MVLSLVPSSLISVIDVLALSLVWFSLLFPYAVSLHVFWWCDGSGSFQCFCCCFCSWLPCWHGGRVLLTVSCLRCLSSFVTFNYFIYAARVFLLYLLFLIIHESDYIRTQNCCPRWGYGGRVWYTSKLNLTSAWFLTFSLKLANIMLRRLRLIPNTDMIADQRFTRFQRNNCPQSAIITLSIRF